MIDLDFSLAGSPSEDAPSGSGDPDRTIAAGGPGPSTDQAPRIDDYQILERIGQAGQGTVWRALQLSTGRIVAIKFLRAGTFVSEIARLRFEREVKLTARLKHPNITAVYDSGIHHGANYYIMEFVDGVPLDKYVRDQSLSVRGTLDLVRRICQAVQHAHQNGIIHRDLKPTNILVTADGQPRVLDFGLAKTVANEDALEVSTEGDAPGTVPFMSPEQAAGKVDVDTRSDVYSLGVNLYLLLTGRYPHDLTGTIPQVRRRIAEAEPLRPRHARKDLDPELEALLLKALAKRPEDRYETAAELARDIDNLLTGEPLLAKPHTLLYFLGKRLRKYRLQVAIAGMVLAALLAMAVLAYVRVAQERNRAEAAAEASRRALYFNSIQLIQSELGHSEVDRARQLLAGCPVDLRGWEWHRLFHVHDQSAMTLGEMGVKVFSVDASPDGSRLLCAGSDGVVGLFDVRSGRRVGQLRGHQGTVYSARWGAAGRFIVSAGADGTVRLWSGEGQGQALAVWTCPAAVSAAVFSPSGDRIAAVGDKGLVRLFDVAGRTELKSLQGHAKDVNAVAFSPDGALLVTGGQDRNLIVWDVARGSKRNEMTGHRDTVDAVAFSPDGTLAASAGRDATVRLWDVGTGAERACFYGHGSFVTSVCFTPDGKSLVSASWDRSIKVWDLERWGEKATLRGHAGPVASVTVLPDGLRLASGGQDKAVKIWNLAGNGADTVLTGHKDVVLAAAFTPDGRRVISAGNRDGMKLWDVTAGRRLLDFTAAPPAGVFALALVEEGRKVVSAGADGCVRLWDAHSGALLKELGRTGGKALAVAADPRGNWIAAAGCETAAADAISALLIWDAQGQQKHALHLPYQVRALAASPDGQRLAVGGTDGGVRLLDPVTGSQLALLAGHTGTVDCLAFAPDGARLASAGADQTIRLWDPIAGKETAALIGHAKPVFALAYQPDGLRLASASEDRTVRLWDTRTGTEAIILRRHDGAVMAVGFSPDGKVILSAGGDGTVRLWDSGAWNASPASRPGAE